MTILAQLTFRVSKQGPSLTSPLQQPDGSVYGSPGGGSGYTGDAGGGFFPPNVASPYFVPTPVYGPTPGATVSGPGVIITAKLPQGKIMQVDHPPTAIPGAAFNLITRFTHKHTGTGSYSIRVKFPQIGIDSTSPPTTVSQNGVGVIISTVTVPGDSATSPIPAVLTGTIELIRTQPAGTSNGVTVDAMQVLDDSRVVTINRIGSVPLPTPIPTNCCPTGQEWDKCGCKCVPIGTVTCQAVNCPTCGQSPSGSGPCGMTVPTTPGDSARCRSVYGGRCRVECGANPCGIACKECVEACGPAWYIGMGSEPGTPSPTPLPPVTLTIVPESSSATYVNITLNGAGFHPNERVVISYFISERTSNQFLFIAEVAASATGTFSKPLAIKVISPVRAQLVRFRSAGKTSGRMAEASFSPMI